MHRMRAPLARRRAGRRFRAGGAGPACSRWVAPTAMVDLPKGTLSGVRARKIYGTGLARKRLDPHAPAPGSGGRCMGLGFQAVEAGRFAFPPAKAARNTLAEAVEHGLGNKGLAAPAHVPEHRATRFPAVAGKEG